MSDETYIHEPEHDHLLDNGEDDLDILDGPEYDDEHDVDGDFCENHTEERPHGRATTVRGSYQYCDDCAEDY
jgi:hypothetical protein